MQEFSSFLKARRSIFGLTQRELADRSGLKQPLIALIENGRRTPSNAARRALEGSLALEPSRALAARWEQVRDIFHHYGLPDPSVFGSVSRGRDTTSSDIDFLVEFSDAHDIVDLLNLQHDLSELLTFDVDVIDSRAGGPVVDHALRDARRLGAT